MMTDLERVELAAYRAVERLQDMSNVDGVVALKWLIEELQKVHPKTPKKD